MKHRGREISVATAILALSAVLAVAAPGYFSRENLSDLFLANVPVLIVALGMTLVILTGQIDISVGSIFAICGVTAGCSPRPDCRRRSPRWARVSPGLQWVR
jgi:rhamnose transport system permease protein